MKTRLSLSIALASYNGERYIAEQLDSIARQTRLPDELIISDDASSDATPAIARDFALRAPFPVRVLQNSERAGSTCNFEIAIRACKGDIIFLCDQDDVWYPDKISLVEERFINNPDAGAVFTDADVVDENLHPIGRRLWQIYRFSPDKQARFMANDALGVLLKQPVVTGATMAFRSSYRDLVLPIPKTWHDAWIALLMGATSHLDALPVQLIAYRQHGQNQLGIPRAGRNRGKSCAAIYGPRVLLYEAIRKRLEESAERFHVSKQTIHRLNEKLVFLRASATLPQPRWRRLPVALHELLALHYHRYAHGLVTFCRDLLR
ncbi:glycosyltransferase family 2 protein [Nitrosospira briensis]|uniref:glycosyltransferase family 2 protein n=1 Tax=Nitrosospira briensis TaxID=35799 RepID=UPI00046A43BC|nr:glycosyltransferase family 2 protein [Nitrosospira briensis]